MLTVSARPAAGCGSIAGGGRKYRRFICKISIISGGPTESRRCHGEHGEELPKAKWGSLKVPLCASLSRGNGCRDFPGTFSKMLDSPWWLPAVLVFSVQPLLAQSAADKFRPSAASSTETTGKGFHDIDTRKGPAGTRNHAALRERGRGTRGRRKPRSRQRSTPMIDTALGVERALVKAGFIREPTAAGGGEQRSGTESPHRGSTMGARAGSGSRADVWSIWSRGSRSCAMIIPASAIGGEHGRRSRNGALELSAGAAGHRRSVPAAGR